MCENYIDIMESQLTHGGNTWQEKRSGDVSNLSLSFNASTSNVSLKKTPSKLANHSGFSSFNGLPKTPSQSIGWKTPKSAGCYILFQFSFSLYMDNVFVILLLAFYYFMRINI